MLQTVSTARTCTVVRKPYSITERPSMIQYKVRQYSDNINSVKLPAWSSPEGSTKLKFPDLITKAQDSCKVISLTHRPTLHHGIILVLISVRSCVDPTYIMQLKDFISMRNCNDTTWDRTNDIPIYNSILTTDPLQSPLTIKNCLIS